MHATAHLGCALRSSSTDSLVKTRNGYCGDRYDRLLRILTNFLPSFILCAGRRWPTSFTSRRTPVLRRLTVAIPTPAFLSLSWTKSPRGISCGSAILPVRTLLLTRHRRTPMLPLPSPAISGAFCKSCQLVSTAAAAICTSPILGFRSANHHRPADVIAQTSMRREKAQAVAAALDHG